MLTYDYVKLKDGTEYKIDEFGTGLKRRNLSSSDVWFGQCTGRLKILDIRAESNTNVKCLLEDGKWYHIGNNGGLVPTLEQREKDNQAKNAQKGAKLAESDNKDKSSNLGVGAVIAGAGTLIGSAKKAIKEYQSIDDMASIEEASKKVFDNMESIWANSNEPIEDDNPNWFVDNDPWEQEEKKRNAKLSNFHNVFAALLREAHPANNINAVKKHRTPQCVKGVPVPPVCIGGYSCLLCSFRMGSCSII